MKITVDAFIKAKGILDPVDLLEILLEFQQVLEVKNFKFMPTLRQRGVFFLVDLDNDVIVGSYIAPIAVEKQNTKEVLLVDSKKILIHESDFPDDLLDSTEVKEENTIKDIQHLISARTYNSLLINFKMKGETKLSQIAKLHPSNLMSIRNFGEGCLTSIGYIFEVAGITFARIRLNEKEVAEILNFDERKTKNE